MNCRDSKIAIQIPHNTDQITVEWARKALISIHQKLQRTLTDSKRLADHPDIKRLNPLSDMLYDSDTRKAAIGDGLDVCDSDHTFDIDEAMLPHIKTFVNGRYKLFISYGLLPPTFVAHGPFIRFQNNRIASSGNLRFGFWNGYVSYYGPGEKLSEFTSYKNGTKDGWSLSFDDNGLVTCAWYENDSCLFGMTHHKKLQMLVVDIATSWTSGESYKYNMNQCGCLFNRTIAMLLGSIGDNMPLSERLETVSLKDIADIFGLVPYL